MSIKANIPSNINFTPKLQCVNVDLITLHQL